MRALALSRVYQFLEPGPVGLLTTAHRGRNNVMTQSWRTMVEFTPPRVAGIVSPANYSFRALRATRECVIAIPSASMAEKVVAIGNCSGRDVDKFARFGLATKPAHIVQAPLLPQCFVNLECRVIDTRLVNKFALFVFEVVYAWSDPAHRRDKTLHHRGYGEFAIDGEIIKLKSAMP